MTGQPISDQDLAQLCVGLYDYAGQPPVKWDYLQNGNCRHGVCFGCKRIGDITAVVYRGTSNFRDALRDIRAAANPCDHGFLGPVHPGIFAGLEAATDELLAKVPGPYVITGHSLGAGRGELVSGLMIERQVIPAGLSVFGPPRVGFLQFSRVIQAIARIRLYRNTALLGDPICDVPLTGLVERYRHPVELTNIHKFPTWAMIRRWAFVSPHDSRLYAAAVPA